MNHYKIYKAIIDKRLYTSKLTRATSYCELHHIIPKSMGGSNNKNNLVYLSPREHFICHYLLVRVHKGTNYYRRMLNAFMAMKRQSGNQKRYINNRIYGYLRKEYSKVQSESVKGKNNKQYGKIWVYNEKTEHSFRIFKDEPIPEGYKKGRVINFEKCKRECKKCGINFFSKTNTPYCSVECKKKYTDMYITPLRRQQRLEYNKKYGVTPEARTKLSAKTKEQHRTNSPRKGKKHSLETRRKMSKLHKNRNNTL